MIYPEDLEFLEHFGVKGMRWGVRSSGAPGVSRGTNRAAKKDAQEFARAKLFYGQGAGTRRKLIKATVEAKSKKDPTYKKAFDHHLAKQDLSKHSTGAQRERSRKDKTEKTKKSAGYLARSFTGEMGTQAAFTAVAVGGAAYLNSSAGRARLSTAMNQVRNIQSNRQARATADFLAGYFSRNAYGG